LTTKSLSDGTSSPASRAPRRSATISETSTSAAAVRTGVVVADSAIRRAIVVSVGVSSRVVTSPFPVASRDSAGAEPPAAAAALTSSTVTRPPGPVPAMPWSETPSSTATRLATGEAFAREPVSLPSGDGPPSAAWTMRDGSGDDARGGRAASPLASPAPFDSVAIVSPTPAVPPSGTRIAASIPSDSAS
jgi:hypothetical protein